MRKIVLDCDYGYDDVVAMMIACGSDKIDLKAITTVSGSGIIDKTVRNILNICQKLDICVPVYAGSNRPLIRDIVYDDNIISEGSGLGGIDLDSIARSKETEHAVVYICKMLMESEDTITLVMTGPLTNLAIALRLCPNIADRIEEVVIMGGSTGRGNITPYAEYNIYSDAEAAKIVFSSGLKITLIGLNVTNRLLCTERVIERVSEKGNLAGELFEKMMSFYYRSEKEHFESNGIVLHDPITVAYLINDDVISTVPFGIEINTEQGELYGKTVYIQNSEYTVQVAVDVDTDKFWEIIENSLSNLE